MKYKVRPSNRFQKDLRLMQKRGYDMVTLEHVLNLLAQGNSLPEKYLDHPLKGNWQGCRECHIESDWLLVYRIEEDVLVLALTRTGTHSDIF